MIPLAVVRDLAKTRALRWAIGAIAVLALVLAAHCSGVRSGSADARLHVEDSVAKVSTAQTRAFDAIRAADAKRFTDSLFALTKAHAVADSIARHANATLGRLTIVHLPQPPSANTNRGDRGDTADRSSAPRPGLGAADGPPDTTAFIGIMREGDPRTYPVPQFVVDAGSELRRALTASQQEAETARHALDGALSAIRADSGAIGSRDATIAALWAAERIAKSSAGRDCRILLFDCPSRRVVAVTSIVLGAAAGYAVAHR